MSKTMKALLPSLFVACLLGGYALADDPLSLYLSVGYSGRSSSSTGGGASTQNGTQTFPDGIVVSIQDAGFAIRDTGDVKITGVLDMTAGTYKGDFLPQANATYALGSAAARWTNVYSEVYRDSIGDVIMTKIGNASVQLNGKVADAANACGVSLGNGTALTNATAKALCVSSAASVAAGGAANKEVFHVGVFGQLQTQAASQPDGGYRTAPVMADPTKAQQGIASGSVTLSVGAGTFTYVEAFTANPFCVCSDATSAVAVVTKCTTDTTTLTVAGVGSDVVNFICVGPLK